MTDLYTKAVLTVIAVFPGALTAMHYSEDSKPLPVQKPDPPFAGVQFTSPNNLTMRTFDAYTGDVWFHGGDGWEYEGRLERVPAPAAPSGSMYQWRHEDEKTRR